MSQYPSQLRAVDPFASYNSDTVNKLTRMMTQGEDLLFSPNSIDIEFDTTSSTDHVVVTTGGCFKDDVWIQVLARHRVDFTNSNHYVQYGGGYNEEGYYYVVLSYDFQKSRPAPQASILIIKPSQRATLFTDQHLFLKAVKVENLGGYTITALYDYDPENPENKRRSTSVFAGREATLPTFTSAYTGQLIYVAETDSYYFGLRDGWAAVFSDAVRINIDTTGVVVGSLIYVDSNGEAALATSDFYNQTAQAVVTHNGVASDGSGKARLYGRVSSVPIESGITVSVGDSLYLSSLEAGSVTNIRTSPLYQFLGKAETGATGPNTIQILFTPGPPTIDAPFAYITTTGLEVGDVMYIKSNGEGGPAQADGLTKFADGVVLKVGTENEKTGIIRLSGGYADDVPIEDGISVSVGDGLYLSETQAGTITNSAPSPFEQYIGTALEAGVGDATAGTRIQILFTPGQGRFSPPQNSAMVSDTFTTGEWTLSGGLYYVDISTADLGSQTRIIVQVFENSGVVYYAIDPEDIELQPSSNNVRIWMPSAPANDILVNVTGG
jgi:hypothetical protein